ncbi:MAG: endonuclease III [Chloroflexaceae bacterium]|nr:endonuclease III [Chloroflexaceae bacterium]
MLSAEYCVIVNRQKRFAPPGRAPAIVKSASRRPDGHRQSSIVNRQSSIVNRQSSIISMSVNHEHIAHVHTLLAEAYGPRRFRGGRNPLDELVMTILSQNTSDRNSGRAYRALRQAYPTWQAVLEAPTGELYEVIKPAGLGNVKAPRIQQTLRAILERRGELSLDFLAELPLNEARAWLLSLDGVGPKTAACVLMFALGLPALPVDTHVHRVSLRLGLLGPKVNAEKAHTMLEAALPAEAVYAFHLNMIQHGRLVCKAQRPLCERCVLREVCAYYRGLVDKKTTEAMEVEPGH